MQINRIESPNFGQVKINKSAYKVLETLPDKSISEMFEKASRIQDTKRWDLHINGHNNNEFFMYFIDKQNKLENSFCGGLYPYARIGKTVSAIGLDAKTNSDENIFYSLKFATEERAQEVCDTLNQPLPENNMDIFRRAVETIKILEESFSFMENNTKQKQKPSLIDNLLVHLGLKK